MKTRNSLPIDGTGSAKRSGERLAHRRQLQKIRRKQEKGRRNVVRVMASLLRLKVLPLDHVSQATEVTRLQLLAASLRQDKFPEAIVGGMLVVDWAARCPELTAHFMESVRRRRKKFGKMKPERFLFLYASMAQKVGRKTFWTGRTRLHTLNFLKSVKADDLLAIGARLAVPRIRASTLLAEVLALPYMGSYTAWTMLRAVAAGAGRRLRDCKEAASSMSPNTSLLAKTLPFASSSKELRRLTGKQYEESLLAYSYCETVKILQHEGVLGPLHHYDSSTDLFAEHLASKECERLADTMEGMTAFELESDAETQLVNDLFPEARRRKHTSTDAERRWRDVKAACL